MSESDSEKNPTPAPKEGRIDRLVYVEAATNSLSAAVESLTLVVKQNTAVVELLRREVNKKPDDVEVQAVAGFSRTERAAYLRKISAIALVLTILSGAFSYYFARQYQEQQFLERNRTFNESCKKNNMVIDTLVDRDRLLSQGETINETPGIGKTRQIRIQAYDRTAQDLIPLKKDCDALYPKEEV